MDVVNGNLDAVNGNLGPVNGNLGAMKKQQIAVGQKLFLAENSEILIFAISLVFYLDFCCWKKGLHWLGLDPKLALMKNEVSLRKHKKFIN